MDSADQAPGYEDERAIRRCLHRYCRGIDRCDAELVASVYHADATDDHGAFKGLGVDFAGYATKALRRHAESTHHMIGEPDIEFISPGVAQVETYVSAVHRCRDDDGPYLERFGGRYVDRFEKRDGEWLIAHRICIHEWNAKERVEPAWQYDRFTEGSRDRSDPSYLA
jgi:ketosteroid isomerase-like protein